LTDRSRRSPVLAPEQMVSRLFHLAATVAHCTELGKKPGRPPAPSEDVQALVEPLWGQAAEEPKSEPNHDRHQDEVTTQKDRWRCRVLSCTRNFHRLKDCKVFGGMAPEGRVKLVERHKLCLGCLTLGYGRAARSCPYKEERVDACKRSACKAGHHYLLHVEKAPTKAK
jgi:coenzyme F420-reducing hydrogenase gamma subunit